MDLRNLIITPEMLKLIAEIDEFKGRWNSAHGLSRDRLVSLKQVATIESIGSSTRIEGARLADQEVERLLRDIETQSFSTRDEQEVAGYAEVMEVIFESHGEISFTENYIKQLHSQLLRHSTKDDRHRGACKKFLNNVEAFDADGNSLGIVFETTSPFETPVAMEALSKWTRETIEDGSVHPLLVASAFTVVFLAIHPFQDGNGRLSRVLTTLLLLKTGYSFVPYSSLESIIERNKEAYYRNLRRTQVTLENEKTDWEPWLRFFLTSLKRQKDHLATKLETNTANSSNDLSPEVTKILEYVERHGRISTAIALELLSIPRPTVKKRLSQLADDGLLVSKGKGRGSYYIKDA